MSELTRCNYCSHQETLRQAKKDGMRVTIMPEDFGLGGVAEYVHPKHVKIRELTPEARKQYHRGWYMELGTQCCC
jgi:hypothetical protein